jgi:acyl transferase domain-containing protein
MSTAKTVFMFSGQGSQYYQMGKGLYEGNPVFRRHLLRLDDIVRGLAGSSVLETLYAPARQASVPFDHTLLSHPAIVMVEYALARTLIEAGVTPDLVLGASLGSYTAAAVAGALDIEQALALALAHARSLSGCAAGAMLAILDHPRLFEQDFLRRQAELAAVNFALHFVVSTPLAQCGGIEQELRRRDIVFQRLPVEYAFHARWIDAARAPFEALGGRLRAGRPRLPMVCCERATLLADLPDTYFWDVTRQPIRFPAAIAELEALGPHRYLDVGPAGTLAVFLKYLLPAGTPSACHAILTPYGHDVANFERLTLAVAA